MNIISTPSKAISFQLSPCIFCIEPEICLFIIALSLVCNYRSYRTAIEMLATSTLGLDCLGYNRQKDYLAVTFLILLLWASETFVRTEGRTGLKIFKFLFFWMRNAIGLSKIFINFKQMFESSVDQCYRNWSFCLSWKMRVLFWVIVQIQRWRQFFHLFCPFPDLCKF